MRLVFIDDSCQRQPLRRELQKLLAFGAVIAPESSMREYSRLLDSIRSRHGLPENEEIKWNAPRGSALGALGEETLELFSTMLRGADDLGMKSVVCIWERNDRWKVEEPEALKKTLKFLYERVERYLEASQDTGVVIADRPPGGRGEETQWISEALDLTKQGTEYVTAERVVMPIVTAPSKLVPLLQLADLVTAGVTAAVAGFPKGLKMVNDLIPLLNTNSRGQVGGTGVKIYPDDLVDLYRIFGDESYYLGERLVHTFKEPWVRSSRRFQLPGRRFQYRDGISE